MYYMSTRDLAAWWGLAQTCCRCIIEQEMWRPCAKVSFLASRQPGADVSPLAIAKPLRHLKLYVLDAVGNP